MGAKYFHWMWESFPNQQNQFSINSCVWLNMFSFVFEAVKGSDLYSFDFGIWQDTQCCQAHHRMRTAR